VEALRQDGLQRNREHKAERFRVGMMTENTGR
jgi:hypothetical protein